MNYLLGLKVAEFPIGALKDFDKRSWAAMFSIRYLRWLDAGRTKFADHSGEDDTAPAQPKTAKAKKTAAPKIVSETKTPAKPKRSRAKLTVVGLKGARQK